MVTGAHCNANFIDDGAEVVRMDAVYHKRNQSVTLRSLSDETRAFNICKLLGGIFQKFIFVSLNFLTVKALDELDSGLKTKSRTNIRCSGLEFKRNFVERGLLEAHGVDHLAAKLIRRHLLEPFHPAVQAADAHRSVHLMT